MTARWCPIAQLRLAYLSVTNAFALLRPLPRSDRDKDAEILALRHQLAVLQRQLGGQKIQFQPADRALLATHGPFDPRAGVALGGGEPVVGVSTGARGLLTSG